MERVKSVDKNKVNATLTWTALGVYAIGTGAAASLGTLIGRPDIPLTLIRSNYANAKAIEAAFSTKISEVTRRIA